MTGVRPATAADIDRVVDTLTTAFFDDPVWGPAFPDVGRRAAQASRFWRLLATSAQRYPWTLVTDKVESVAIWIPPGGIEVTDEEHAGLADFLIDLAGQAVAARILTIFDQFDELRPSEPHYYLTLLATHSDHRGSGLGMGLLRESLARIDALGLPAYLESTNAANLERYAEVGFVARDELVTELGPAVWTMLRPARS